jgi:hypothetical protein
LSPVLADPDQQPLDDAKGLTIRRPRGVGRQKTTKEKDDVDRWPMGNRLGQVGQADQHQEDKRHRGEQCVESQGAGEERDVVFVSRLKGAGEKTSG